MEGAERWWHSVEVPWESSLLRAAWLGPEDSASREGGVGEGPGSAGLMKVSKNACLHFFFNTRFSVPGINYIRLSRPEIQSGYLHNSYVSIAPVGTSCLAG